jgi:Gar1/Naf1 RNA binding region
MGEGSVFCSEARRCIGRVAEIFGQVTDPFYAVPFCGSSGGAAPSLDGGDRVFTVPSLSHHVDCDAARTAAPARDRDEADVDVDGGDDEDGDEEAGSGGGIAETGVSARSSGSHLGSAQPYATRGGFRGRGRAGGSRGRGRCARRHEPQATLAPLCPPQPAMLRTLHHRAGMIGAVCDIQRARHARRAGSGRGGGFRGGAPGQVAPGAPYARQTPDAHAGAAMPVSGSNWGHMPHAAPYAANSATGPPQVVMAGPPGQQVAYQAQVQWIPVGFPPGRAASAGAGPMMPGADRCAALSVIIVCMVSNCSARCSSSWWGDRQADGPGLQTNGLGVHLQKFA